MTVEQKIVLVVDDDPAIRGLLIEILSDEGLAVVALGNGEEALQWLRAHPRDACVVLLDLMMPVMDGFEFLAIKAKDPVLVGVPVVVITASGNCAEIVRTYNVIGCLTKPFSIEALMLAVKACRTESDPNCPPALAA